ncbi:MAG: hypothetical protein HUN04_14755 [Desulfobacter sp.]|nr:MAG: hypothetical protein HUN04_14755 [Desulfobacter sp.]
MAIINCAECTRKISSKATSCPHCGNPVNQQPTVTVAKKSGGKWEAAGFFLIIIGLFLCFKLLNAGLTLMFLGLGVFIVGRFK